MEQHGAEPWTCYEHGMAWVGKHCMLHGMVRHPSALQHLAQAAEPTHPDRPTCMDGSTSSVPGEGRGYIRRGWYLATPGACRGVWQGWEETKPCVLQMLNRTGCPSKTASCTACPILPCHATSSSCPLPHPRHAPAPVAHHGMPAQHVPAQEGVEGGVREPGQLDCGKKAAAGAAS